LAHRGAAGGDVLLAVKAGPKKARAKAEEEAKAKAIEEHRVRGKKTATRKSSKVTRYSYKESDTAKRQRVDRYLAEMQRVFGMREPRHEDEFLAFHDNLKADEIPFALKLFQMSCDHPKTEIIAQKGSWTSGEPVYFTACVRCALVRRDAAPTFMLREEWDSHCPEGYDAFDWGDLFTKDKTLWRFIHDEVLAEQVSGSMTEED
jgi:hypothetical protein